MPLDRNQLEKMTIAEVQEVPVPERVLGFFSVGEIDRALAIADYSVEEEIGTIMDMARGDDPKLQISAYKYLRERVKEAAQAEGLFARLEQTEIERGEDGHEVRRVASTSTLIQRLQQEKVRERNLDADADHRAERYLPGATLEPAVLRDGAAAGTGDADTVPAASVSAGGGGDHGPRDPGAGELGRTAGRTGEADAAAPVRAELQPDEH
jgi:hypothetical protein